MSSCGMNFTASICCFTTVTGADDGLRLEESPLMMYKTFVKLSYLVQCF